MPKQTPKSSNQILKELDHEMSVYLKIIESQGEKITDDKWMKRFDENLDVRGAVMREKGEL